MNQHNSTTEDEIEKIVARINANTKLLPLPEVIKEVGIRTTHIYNLIKDGRFPAPVKLSRRKVVWLSDDIIDWKKNAVREALKSSL